MKIKVLVRTNYRYHPEVINFEEMVNDVAEMTPRQTTDYGIERNAIKGCSLIEDQDLLIGGSLSQTKILPTPEHNSSRLCRQYLECLSFSVEWEDDDFGICSIYDGILSKLDLLYALSTTMYMPCPSNFEWDIYTRKCYSFIHLDPANMTIAVKYDLRWSWLGMYRPSSTNDLLDFRYNSNGERIQYALWKNGEPNNKNENKICIVAEVEQGALMWEDVSCEIVTSFICEI
ncbi:hypothetical protein LSH36_296g02007 [Paralvinella palmiformis]|uniref:C-type lectin domain-containing protein n=1 Tax=Paralvinella palmiformis TaxID=53620 RepID=A0AAD9N1N7_9ANNE|nr:hypothetical protein LSH36_296g02007 [Paralvinella palmiformis]